eukprot:TRINITY_DN2308_c0_g1_i1.p1 TRINITY_DN2308_c0_g1~~TRINITY_DN2308_c0_g1_i1.p1  ORF type:complete len:318 (+),score=70.01 TRINITY_DN2308_c0_g1_i1:113-955(+)
MGMEAGMDIRALDGLNDGNMDAYAMVERLARLHQAGQISDEELQYLQPYLPVLLQPQDDGYEEQPELADQLRSKGGALDDVKATSAVHRPESFEAPVCDGVEEGNGDHPESARAHALSDIGDVDVAVDGHVGVCDDEDEGAAPDTEAAAHSALGYSHLPPHLLRVLEPASHAKDVLGKVVRVGEPVPAMPLDSKSTSGDVPPDTATAPSSVEDHSYPKRTVGVAENAAANCNQVDALVSKSLHTCGEGSVNESKGVLGDGHKGAMADALARTRLVGIEAE